ncbi:hypothetical protein DBR11_25610 [Pedobacter sp. HMWF019]|uniref:hypothetical protein n=1 Tax=Pedobacter sp. HMWF019 TaxID=2056856 RepID=UPI000D3A9BE3|nr:hypothetical protein [Pedobacter sp. HMWF019]PTS93358.1 hypothetical protein DBR11_25610 [Pedobacter sp. HMWF019]
MKIKILLLLCIATLGLASCKKETYVQETKARTYNLKIRASDWKTTDNGETYSYTWNTSAIDQITFDDEAVVVYIAHPDNPNLDIAIPSVYNSISYTYRVFNGGLIFNIQSSDNQDTKVPAPTVDIPVKVVIIPSVYGG